MERVKAHKPPMIWPCWRQHRVIGFESNYPMFFTLPATGSIEAQIMHANWLINFERAKLIFHLELIL